MKCIRCVHADAIAAESSAFQLCTSCVIDVERVMITPAKDQDTARRVMHARYGYRTAEERACAD